MRLSKERFPLQKSMTQKQKTLVGGVSILGIAGIICKVVGVLYRIPLAHLIGPEGMGVYHKVYPAYNLLLTISSAGLPVAISRMVAHYVTREDPRNARRIFTMAMRMLLVLGLFLIEAVFCIHSVKSVELVNAITYGGRSACQYPIDIFPRPLRVLFTVIAPFALTLHVPAAYILGKPLYGWPDWTAFVAPLAGAVLFAVMYLAFQKAMQFYRSTGS